MLMRTSVHVPGRRFLLFFFLLLTAFIDNCVYIHALVHNKEFVTSMPLLRFIWIYRYICVLFYATGLL